MIFLFCFGLVKQTNNKVYILSWVFKVLLVERFNWLAKHKSLLSKVQHNYCALFRCTKFCCISPWSFYLKVKYRMLHIKIHQFSVKQKKTLSHFRVYRKSALTLHKMCKNTGFHWSVFFRIRTEFTILSLYGRMRVSEKLYSCIFYAV